MEREYHNVRIASELCHSMIYVGIFQSRDQIGSLYIVVIGERFPIDTVLVKTDSVATFISVLKCMQPLPSAVVD